MLFSRRDYLKVLTCATAGSLVSLRTADSASAALGTGNSLGPAPEAAQHSKGADRPPGSVPVIYSTDLFHPPDDPDDHVDLATLFSLPELDVRAIILDLGHQQGSKPGEIPVRQMAALTGRQVPHATGLLCPLRYPEDKAENQFGKTDSAINLILQTLRDSERKVSIFTTGSLRDVAAALNRDEDLFRAKVARIYVNAGNSAGSPTEWNTLLDPQAYIRLMGSDLPVYWCPCFGPGATLEALFKGTLKPQPYSTYWKFTQQEVFEALPPRLQNYFLYALGRKLTQLEDPIAYLNRVPEESLKETQWKARRNMWGTGPLIHAAGRQLYRQGDMWSALASPARGLQPSKVFDFIPVNVTIDRDMKTTMQLSDVTGKMKVFHPVDLENYQAAMTTSLRKLLAEMPRVNPAA